MTDYEGEITVSVGLRDKNNNNITIYSPSDIYIKHGDMTKKIYI